MPPLTPPTAPSLLALMTRRGIRPFTGPLNLNLVGIRGPGRRADAWDDLVGVVYQDWDGAWQVEFYPATTDPGLYHLQNPGRRAGTAILVADRRYPSCYTFGLHRGQYSALVQRGNMAFVRDPDRDASLDVEQLVQTPGAIFEGTIGCNLHRASAHRLVENVGKYSAACQVIRDPAHFAALMDLCHVSAEEGGYGPFFSYALLNWDPSLEAA